MILHLIDDEKIAPRTIALFEKALPGQNLFICFRMSTRRVSPSKNVLFNDQVESMDFAQIKTVFIHYLSTRKIDFIEQHVKHNVQTYWFVWGGDIYNDLMTSHGFDTFYEPLYGGGRLFIMNTLAKIGIKPFHNKELRFIKNSIDYVITSKEEYECFSKYLKPYLPPLYDFGFYYYPVDSIVGTTLADKWCDTDSKLVVVGNSGSVSNNHCYAFRYLKKSYSKGWTVTPIISYGGTNRYIDHINARGRSLFQGDYLPQTTFLPLEEYNSFMLQAAFYVYGSWRQEAIGNIMIALYMGAKVFISQKSPLLGFYRNKGLLVYELEQMNRNSLQPLSYEQRLHNRGIMRRNYNEKDLTLKIQQHLGE